MPPREILQADFGAGEIFKLKLGSSERLFISCQALLKEICDEKRFTKKVSGALNQIRNAVEDGLFTAHFGEHNWDIVHRTLVPAFGPIIHPRNV
jgi:cytochrome P450 / NADPH-cytochrome P450 reductase